MPRRGSRTAAAFKMKRFVIIVNGFQSLTITTKRSILNVAAVLDLPLMENLDIHQVNTIFQISEKVRTIGPVPLKNNFFKKNFFNPTTLKNLRCSLKISLSQDP